MRSMILSACSISSIDSLRHYLGQRSQAPIVQQPVVQPVLVDGGEFVPQRPVEIFDDFGIAFHVHSSCEIRRDRRDQFGIILSLRKCV